MNSYYFFLLCAIQCNFFYSILKLKLSYLIEISKIQTKKKKNNNNKNNKRLYFKFYFKLIANTTDKKILKNIYLNIKEIKIRNYIS
jgi:hypothetical protein